MRDLACFFPLRHQGEIISRGITSYVRPVLIRRHIIKRTFEIVRLINFNFTGPYTYTHYSENRYMFNRPLYILYEHILFVVSIIIC